MLNLVNDVGVIDILDGLLLHKFGTGALLGAVVYLGKLLGEVHLIGILLGFVV